jgi:long-subunit acyl-CoA synthetase (AMP-forming)
MTEPKRLFDCINYQLENYPKDDMLAAREGGLWKTYSTKDIRQKVDSLTAGLLQLGVSGNDMTARMAYRRYGRSTDRRHPGANLSNYEPA